MRLRGLGSGLLAAALVLAGTGCGGKVKLIKVEGIVTLDGNPVEGAMVTFIPQEEHGNAASALTQSDGSFHLTTVISGTVLDGALPGHYKVTVTKRPAVDWEDSETPEVTDQKEMLKKYAKFRQNKGKYMKSSLPAVYEKASTTPLHCQVPPPEAKVVLELTSSLTGGTGKLRRP